MSPILVIGGGKMGLSHMAILTRLLEKGAVALCEPAVLSRFAFSKIGIRSFRSLDDALTTNESWQGAIVATPTSSHFSIAKTLLERGIPCFIEKPLTLDPSKSQQLVDLQARRGTYVQMGLVTRFILPFIRLRQIVYSELLGRPIHYRARMMGNVVTKPGDSGWRTDFSLGGGCLNEYGPHLLDLCRSIFGDVRQVTAARYGQVYSTRADDRFEVQWQHSNGIQGELLLDWCDSSRRKSAIDFEVHFEHGSITANNAEMSVHVADGAPVNAEQRGRLLASMLPYPVNFYLRGEEFSLQLEVFLQRICGQPFLRATVDPDLAATIGDGLAVDCLIREIATVGKLA